MRYFPLKREWVPLEGSITTHLGFVLPKSYHSLFRRKVPPHSTQWIINLDKSKWNVEVTKNGFLKNILSGVWRSFRLQNHKSGLWRFLNIFLNSGPLCGVAHSRTIVILWYDSWVLWPKKNSFKSDATPLSFWLLTDTN